MSDVAPGTIETLIKEHISALIQLTSKLEMVALFDQNQLFLLQAQNGNKGCLFLFFLQN